MTVTVITLLMPVNKLCEYKIYYIDTQFPDFQLMMLKLKNDPMYRITITTSDNRSMKHQIIDFAIEIDSMDQRKKKRNTSKCCISIALAIDNVNHMKNDFWIAVPFTMLSRIHL